MWLSTARTEVGGQVVAGAVVDDEELLVVDWA